MSTLEITDNIYGDCGGCSVVVRWRCVVVVVHRGRKHDIKGEGKDDGYVIRWIVVGFYEDHHGLMSKLQYVGSSQFVRK